MGGLTSESRDVIDDVTDQHAMGTFL